VLYILQIDTIGCQNCALEYSQDRVMLYVLLMDTIEYRNREKLACFVFVAS